VTSGRENVSTSAVGARGSDARVPPRDVLERELWTIWSEIVRHDEFGVHETFFDAGGTSLDLLRLQGRIKTEFGYDVSLTALLSAPTVSGNALLLRGAATDDRSLLVPFREEGVRTPLFCLHPLGGSVAVYYPLARALGDDQPVYGIQAAGLNAGQQPHTTMEQMVEAYVGTIESAQPTGPYRLLGFSVGGTIALACAHALAEATGSWPLVVLVATATRHELDPKIPYIVVGNYGLQLALRDDSELTRLERRQALERMHGEGTRRGAFTRAFPIDQLERIFDTAHGILKAASEHELRPYPGETVMFADTDTSSCADWSDYAPALTCYSIDVTHRHMLEAPSAGRIADLLAPHLEDEAR
jgi:thioesterase domain-containing protein